MRDEMNMRYVAVKTAAQTVTDAAADLGAEINCRGFNTMTVFLDVDINSSNNVRLHVLGKLTEDATNEYQPVQIGSPTAGVAPVDYQYYEINNDADQKIWFTIDVSGLNVVQLQVWAGTVGATGADIESCYVHLSNS